MEFSLYGTEWHLAMLDYEQIEAENERASVTLQLAGAEDGARASGCSGCNRYMGRVRVEGEAFAFNDIGVTRMECPPPQMLLEARYLRALASVTRWANSDNDLLLSGNGVALHFVAAQEA